MTKVPIWLVALLLIQGVIFGWAWGYMMSKSLPYILDWEKIQWEVIDIVISTSDGTTMYSPEFSYETPSWEKKEWNSSWSSSSNSYRKGDSINLLYNSDLDEAKIDWFFELYFGWIFLFVWVMEMLVLIFLLWRAQVLKKRRDDLIFEWNSLKAEIVSIDKWMFVQNKKSSYHIMAQAENQDDWKMYIFRSEALNFKPVFKEWELIDVFIKPMDYSTYYVDVRELKEKYVYA